MSVINYMFIKKICSFRFIKNLLLIIVFKKKPKKNPVIYYRFLKKNLINYKIKI